ncbi:hypothetical protein [Flammeovirga aprica]|uniref:Uncharacterized protein n=1 Tax=Flammeovirga aprica JL-4 TaxID=694437 RepID=A0A7X9S1Q5_9BACT|nr:hypothetical protein [Flammeovirga aprica]NME72783.1 hypothetical protein [Flammeovirga aprica JL-4]
MKKLILILIIASSCNPHRFLYKPNKKWILNYKLQESFDSSFFTITRPILIEFNKNGTQTLSQLGYKETKYNWSINEDTLLFESDKSIIKKLDKDSLILQEHNGFIYFSRAKKIKINKTKEEIKTILQTYNWINKQDKEVEFFDNGTMIESELLYNYNLEDSAKTMTVNNWGIAEFYENLYLYYFVDLTTNSGYRNVIYQLNSVTDNSFSFFDEYGKLITYKRKFSESKLDSSLLQGKWVSHNSLDKKYQRYTKELYSGDDRVVIFDGDLIMEIENDVLTFQIDSLRKIKYNWRINKEGNVLFLDEKMTLDNGKEVTYGIHVLFINSFTDDLIKSRLECGVLYGELSDENSYYLNILQDFHKVK